MHENCKYVSFSLKSDKAMGIGSAATFKCTRLNMESLIILVLLAAGNCQGLEWKMSVAEPSFVFKTLFNNVETINLPDDMCVYRIIVKSKQMTRLPSEVVLWFKDPMGTNDQAKIQALVHDYKTKTSTLNLNSPKEIKKVKITSLWNPARIEEIILDYSPCDVLEWKMSVAEPSFVFKTLFNNVETINLPDDMCVYRIIVKSKQMTRLPSEVVLWFKDPMGTNDQAKIQAYLHNDKTKTSTLNLSSPKEIKKVKMTSWWNPATIEEIILDHNYSPCHGEGTHQTPQH
ncbi:unnamed protein product [Owenia fusiformis]|uniref:Uncharacterized protein n=1 Tax=Owenia fusiformis TaxID=6347 RepID=A0A8J1U223_OWEFU|nr:unnamed protein product [Owenia fusiformis]